MKKYKNIIVVFLMFVVATICSFFIGYRIACDKIENTQTDNSTETFYAEIIDVGNNTLSVQGIELNDINFRGQFILGIDDSTKLVWRGTTISLSELKAGNMISVTYTGLVLETAPAQINEVVKIQLLDDNK